MLSPTDTDTDILGMRNDLTMSCLASINPSIQPESSDCLIAHMVLV